MVGARSRTVASISRGGRGTARHPLGRERPPTTAVKVGGEGFAPYEAVDVYFDTRDQALAIADGSGTLPSIGIRIPAAVKPGRHWISEVGRRTRGAQSPFLVNTNWAEFGFEPQGGRNNIYENVLTPADAVALNTLWTATIGGPQFFLTSSPAVADGVVYVGSYDNKVYALNATTGATLWTATTTGRFAHSSPAVANGVVQEAQSGACHLDRLANAGTSMRWQIAHDDEVVWLKRRRQHLLDVGQEGIAVHRTIENHGRGEAAQAQRPN